MTKDFRELSDHKVYDRKCVLADQRQVKWKRTRHQLVKVKEDMTDYTLYLYRGSGTKASKSAATAEQYLLLAHPCYH